MTEARARGVWAPALTPIDDRGRPDAARFVAHARWLLADGCHGVGLFGTTSEANSFSVEQRMGLLEATLAASVPAERLMVGTGCCAQADTVRLTAHAVEQGCRRILMLPPFYYKGVPEAGLFRSFAEVIEQVGRGRFDLYLYHIPPVAQVPLPMGLIERLASAYPETLKGVKDSSGDLEHGLELIRRFPTLEILPGAETFLLDTLEIGGAGCISASANVNAKAIRAVYDAFEAGGCETAERQASIAGTRALLQRYPMIPALKHLIAAWRGDAGWRATMPPLMPLAEADGAALVQALAEAGLAPKPG